ncbi:FeoB-associated Cys-rich membrane protein [Abyssicoccus albus]|uniref:FeoB-associated Cys-rich membrane protein n=1 Tax=Abyssicoccus albus TaxID=1817405 RepID=UPI0012602A80|nr:FeoB-associated Cys-rich membrane protein [Abyssicoccus albus]
MAVFMINMLLILAIIGYTVYILMKAIRKQAGGKCTSCDTKSTCGTKGKHFSSY